MDDSGVAEVHLLDVIGSLASRLRDDDRVEARESLVLRTTVVPRGAWTLQDEGPRGHPFGAVVVDGLLQREVTVTGRTSLSLLGRGDVVLPRPAPGEALDARIGWRAAVPTRVAILDDRLQPALALWPGLALGILDHVAEQMARGAVQGTISQLPRVEDRFEATFWELADRFGRVTPTGIQVPLHLTHEALARLVGGRRPTISLALGALAEREVVRRRPDGTWLLTARTPSPPTGEQPAETPLVALERDTAPPERRLEPTPWAAAARDELLATARRAGVQHAHAAESVSAN